MTATTTYSYCPPMIHLSRSAVSGPVDQIRVGRYGVTTKVKRESLESG